MILLIICLLFFIFYFNFWPIIKSRYKKNNPAPYGDLNEVYSKVLNGSLVMLESKKIKMSFNEQYDFYSFLSKCKRFIKRSKSYENYRYYNFPRAWLMIGLLDSYEFDNSKNTLAKLNNSMEKIIDSKGNLLFDFDKLDQVLFGVVFCRMYQITKEKRYANSANFLYRELSNFEFDGLLLYRKKLKVYFTDSIGISVPFLYIYYSYNSDPDVIKTARQQLDYYIQNGLDEKNKLPFHAVDLSTNIRLGSINWTRGVAWFLIGLSYAIKYETDSGRIKEYSSLYSEVVCKLQSVASKESYWPQFFSHSNDGRIDSSATLMIYYSMSICNYKGYEFRDLSNAMKNSIDEEGMVLNSSGDTIYINRYSTIQSISELSQGLLTALLSKENNHNQIRNINVTTLE
jgi:rhamnogalacturonyl hydrolase YesR